MTQNAHDRYPSKACEKQPKAHASTTVILADANDAHRERLERACTRRFLRTKSCREGRTLRGLVETHSPDLIVMELRLADGPTLKLIEWLRSKHATSKIAVFTSYGSVATAVRCTKLGVHRYYTKEVPVECLLDLAPDHHSGAWRVPTEPVRLERAVWEYLHRLVDRSGSIASAASVLGLDRRSVRRMLGRHAPSC